MAESLSEAKVTFVDSRGRPAGELRVVPDSGDPYILQEVTSEEAMEWNEEAIQLLEGRTYEFELHGVEKGLRIREERPVIRRSRLSGAEHRLGTIQTGAYTGLLPLTLEDDNGTAVATAAVEVRSAKLGYRSHYRHMLDFIAERCTEFLLDIRAPSRAYFAPHHQDSADTLAQRFAFLQSLLSGRDFHDAVERILAAPHIRLRQEEEHRDIRRGFTPSGKVLNQLASSQPRVPLPPTHHLHNRLPTVPAKLRLTRSVDTIDTPENRFVKHALTSFESTLLKMEQALQPSSKPADVRLGRSIAEARRPLSQYLARDFFRDVGAPDFLPLSSPVLQRRPGYREVLQAWLKFDLAARLVWAGGNDVYQAGKRDVATLYEYWIFFKLLDLVTQRFDLGRRPVDTLLEPTQDGFGLKLKTGSHLSVGGRYTEAGRQLKIRFSYNRTFTRGKKGHDSESNYPAMGSWTRAMRPDYTLSLWPAAFRAHQAEQQELMVHIHFDAKYRVDNITQLFGKESQALDEADEDERKERTSKREDLLKMHAYRDAIRRSEAAFVLYPGDETQRWRGYRELLPSLGAYPVYPGRDDDGLGAVGEFIDAAVREVCNRASLREQQSYHVRRVQSQPIPPFVNRTLPERTAQGGRELPPAEHLVLLAWIENEEELERVARTGLYCLRVTGGEETSALDPKVVAARHLLFFSRNRHAIPGLWKTTEPAPRLSTGSSLVAEGALTTAEPEAIYLVYRVAFDDTFPGWTRNPFTLPETMGNDDGPPPQPVAITLERLAGTA